MASDVDLKGVVRVLPVVPRASGALSGMRNVRSIDCPSL